MARGYQPYNPTPAAPTGRARGHVAAQPQTTEPPPDWEAINASARARLNPAAPNYIGDGYAAFEGADGALELRVVDEAANKNWAATKGPNATVAPSSNPAAIIDPATGQPLGQAPAPPPPVDTRTVGQRLTANVAAAAPAAPAQPALQTRGAFRQAPATPGTTAGARIGQQVAGDLARQPGVPAAPQGPYTPQAADYSRYDAAAEELRASRDVFQNELRRLSGVDPFGNQAFLQKATDRAVSQAAGTAAMARGGAAAQAGAQRAQQGVQSQLASRGIQEMEQTVARDANTAAGLRLQAAGGMADVSGRLAENEVAFANKAADVGVANLQAAMDKYGIDAQIGQRERESLRSLAVEMQQVDMERYKTDMSYRANVDDNIIAKYVSDNQLKGVLEQIEASENISFGEGVMGVLGMASGVAMGVATAPAGSRLGPAVAKSDRRSKFAIQAPRLKDLKEYLATTKGSMYQYRRPNAPGQRHGENFGPMAQDLQKTKIGRTVVVEKADGLYVDTGRLALADHGALAALAARVERLARRVGKK